MLRLVKKLTRDRVYYYVVENRIVDGKLRRQYVESLGEVSERVAQAALIAHRRRSKAKAAASTRFDSICAEFLEYYRSKVSSGVSPRSVDIFAEQSRRWVEYLGRWDIRDIGFREIEAYKMQLPKNLSNRTVNINLIELRKPFKYACDLGVINAVPPIRALPEKRHREIEILTAEEIQALLAAASPKQRLYLHTMLNLGLRPSECMRLRWSDVDFKKRVVTIRSDSKLKIGRVIPINSKLLAVFNAAKEWPRDDDRVCPFSRADVVKNALNRVGARAGVKVNAYKLRKTFASVLAASGVSAIDLAKLMGHKSIQTTLQYYVQLEPDSLRSSVEKIGI